MKHLFGLSLAVLALAAGSASAQVAARPAIVTTTTVTVQPASQAALQKLTATAQRLREAIAVLSGKPAGPERDAALREARNALARTQQAMNELPGEYRVATLPARPGYDASVQALTRASDTLMDAIHAMAHEPAGARRTQAIRAANQALLDTQSAIVQAYDATLASNETASRTVTLGAGPAARTITIGPGSTANCVRLAGMLGCQ